MNKNEKMKINDFMLCTFVGYTETPPNTFVAEITDVNTLGSTFKCYLPDTNQKFNFHYSFNSSGPWYGTDESGAGYEIATHDIYTPGAIDPYPQGAAVVTFNDNKRFLCYVDSVEPFINVIFYNYPFAEIEIENETITNSNWDIYPLGGRIKSIEGCILNEDILVPEITDTPLSTSEWPLKPDFIRPYSRIEREDKFGKFRFVPAPDESNGDGIKILDNWKRDNIIKIQLPILYKKRIIRGSTNIPYTERNCELEFHKNGADNFKQLWKDWEYAGLIDKIIDCSLPYVPRFIRGTQGRNPRPLSNHAWGTAFDINVKWNRLGKVPALYGQEGCVRELVALANKNGFFWGGHFGDGRIDGMHFELGYMI